MVLRAYCRVAVVVFLLFTIYPFVTKVLEHRLAHDWAHNVLHLISAAIGICAGWFARGGTLAALFTWTVAITYGVLGVAGWFIDGLLMGMPAAIPLGPVDNIFHLLLCAGAITALIISRARTR